MTIPTPIATLFIWTLLGSVEVFKTIERACAKRAEKGGVIIEYKEIQSPWFYPVICSESGCNEPAPIVSSRTITCEYFTPPEVPAVPSYQPQAYWREKPAEETTPGWVTFGSTVTIKYDGKFTP